MRRSRNVISGGTGILDRIVGEGRRLGAGYVAMGRDAGILGRSTEYKKFGLSDPADAVKSGRLDKNLADAKAKANEQNQPYYKKQKKWRERSRDANENRDGQPANSYTRKGDKLVPTPKSFGH